MFDAQDERIVVTGIGMVTPLGSDRESSWRQLQAGVSGMRWLPEIKIAADPHGVNGNNGRCFVAGAPAAFYEPQNDRDVRDPVVELALKAAGEAVDDAGLDIAQMRSDRIGCVIGTSKGGLQSFARAFLSQHNTGGSSNSGGEYERFWLQFLPHAAAQTVAEELGLHGAIICPVAACATGLISLQRGADLIRQGYCDVVLAGSSDASLQTPVLASLRRMGVMAHNFADPTTACRPFDRRRNGFLVGEGAAVLVMERLEHALARGTTPYAQWLACETANDAHSLTHLSDEPVSLTRLITNVLRRGDIAPDEIDYANLHGTATLQNDLFETRALKSALGSAARRTPLSSSKSMIGHLLGAAGSVEMAVTLLAMRDSVIPPTINLREPDQQCDLDYTPLTARSRRIETALKVSLGFGGHLVAAAVRKL